MGIKVKVRNQPGKLSPKALQVIRDVEGAGFVSLGWLSVVVFSPVSLAAFGNADGTVALGILGTTIGTTFDVAGIDLMTELDSGETVTTTTTGSTMPQPERGIHKYTASPTSGVRNLCQKHEKNLANHAGKRVAHAASIGEFSAFVERFLRHEFEGLLLRHWLTPPARHPSEGLAAGGLEGGYVSQHSKQIRIGLDKGKFLWGGWDIHDSGSYKVVSQNDRECVVVFKSDLGGAKRMKITRQGRKYLFTPQPDRTEPEIFLRIDGAEFLLDSKEREETEKPTLGEHETSGEMVPVEKTVEEFEKGFNQNVRKEVIPLLISEGVLSGKKEKQRTYVLDNDVFRLTMRFGIENFVNNQQGWSFVAFKEPIDTVAEALQKHAGALNYRKDVGASKLAKNASVSGGSDKRHLFLVRFPESKWTILLQTVHWITRQDIDLGMELAVKLSRNLKSVAIAACDTDVAGSFAVSYKAGKRTEEFSDEQDWVAFYGLFYKKGIFLPELFIAGNEKQARLMLSNPKAVERVDQLQIALPKEDND